MSRKGYSPSHDVHMRVECGRCGGVIRECKCIAPKVPEIVSGPCLRCQEIHDAEIERFKILLRSIQRLL